jgi:hypothetical protein
MNNPKKIDDVRAYINDESWIPEALDELEEEFEKIDNENKAWVRNNLPI